MRKTKKILIRVSKTDKELAEELSEKKGMNTSEYFRTLLREDAEDQHLKLHLKIVDKYEKQLTELRSIVGAVKNKRKG
jgi:antitoxin component of RelBE/YafQ-DinJ toxin-antitoxin module